jgi:hypothetical protein
VERQEIAHLTSRDSRVLSEMWLVEEGETRPRREEDKILKTAASPPSSGAGKSSDEAARSQTAAPR